MADEHLEPDIDDIRRRMDGAMTALKAEFTGLRTGRASASLVEPIQVEAYGQTMPLNQVGSISVPEPRMISIQVWDKSTVSAVEKAIQNAGLGINPVVDGQSVRIPIPELNEERRIELTKVAAKYAEQARVAVRNVRRDGMEQLKKFEKDGHMSQDEHKMWSEEIQGMTDDHIKKIDDALAKKDAEIMQV